MPTVRERDSLGRNWFGDWRSLGPVRIPENGVSYGDGLKALTSKPFPPIRSGLTSRTEGGQRAAAAFSPPHHPSPGARHMTDEHEPSIPGARTPALSKSGVIVS